VPRSEVSEFTSHGQAHRCARARRRCAIEFGKEHGILTIEKIIQSWLEARHAPLTSSWNVEAWRQSNTAASTTTGQGDVCYITWSSRYSHAGI
jgi:hypothetical protein